MAFYAKFEDSSQNEYWMEFDYPNNSKVQDKINANPAYILLKNMPEQIDTVLSFFYMGELEWDPMTSYETRLRIRVIPFVKDFNFDSSKVANAKGNK